jgi:ATP-dependent DNA helicase RecG
LSPYLLKRDSHVVNEIPYDALREVLINAFAHRDYFEKGANVMVKIFDDRIDIKDIV